MWATLAARGFFWSQLRVFCAWLLLPSACAWAEPLVLVLTPQGQPPRSGLVQALQIQLAHEARIEAGAVLPEGSLATRVHEASRLASGRRALLALWVESGSETESARELVLYVVGERDGQALVEVLRLPAGDDPAADRSLALKVREVLDTLASAQAPATAQATVPTTAPTTTSTTPQATAQPSLAAVLAPPVKPQAWPVGVVVRAAALLLPTSGGADLPWAVAVAAGPELRVQHERFSALLGVRWLPGFRAERGGATVRVAELDPQLALGAQHEHDRWLVGLWLVPTLRIVAAEGRTPLGAYGARTDLDLSLVAQLSVELRVSTHVGVALGLGAELPASPHRYTVNEQAVLPASSVRALGSLALVFRL